MPIRSFSTAFLAMLLLGFSTSIRADDASIPADAMPEEAVAETARPAAEEAPKPVKKVTVKRHHERAEAFVAPADWEYDGLVAGGQDQDVRSMFYLADLVYLNIGSDQGLSTGDRVSIYKRGDRIKDPESGKSMGYEIRRAAITQVTDKISAKNCSVRILQAYEAVEIGDLVRRDE